MNMMSKLHSIFLTFFALSFLYNFLIETSLIMKYISLLVCIIDFNVVFFMIGIYNYHHDHYDFLLGDDENE